MWSWYQGLSSLGGKFSHVEGKRSLSGSGIFGSQFQVSSRTFGSYFVYQNGTPPFVMGRRYPPSLRENARKKSKTVIIKHERKLKIFCDWKLNYLPSRRTGCPSLIPISSKVRFSSSNKNGWLLKQEKVRKCQMKWLERDLTTLKIFSVNLRFRKKSPPLLLNLYE